MNRSILRCVFACVSLLVAAFPLAQSSSAQSESWCDVEGIILSIQGGASLEDALMDESKACIEFFLDETMEIIDSPASVADSAESSGLVAGSRCYSPVKNRLITYAGVNAYRLYTELYACVNDVTGPGPGWTGAEGWTWPISYGSWNCSPVLVFDGYRGSSPYTQYYELWHYYNCYNPVLDVARISHMGVAIEQTGYAWISRT
jgi:hypothetical protein